MFFLLGLVTYFYYTYACFVVDLKHGIVEYEKLYKYILHAQQNNLNVHFANTSMPFIWENIVPECINITLIDETKLQRYDYRQHCLLKIFKDAHKQFHPQTILSKSQNGANTKLAIGVPVSSRGIPFIQYLPLFTHLLPSLLKSKMDFYLMVSFDEGDYFFDNHKRDYILTELDKIGVNFDVLKFPRFKALNFLWNWMFYHVYLRGFTHFFQVNDDAIISGFEFNPEPLLLTGPFDLALPYIFTQAMVNIKAHNKLTNGTLYPPEFINWGGDLWLTKLYKHSSRFIGIVNNTRPHSQRARYQPCR